MPRFFEGFLIVLMIFCFCVGLAIIIKFSVLWIENNQAFKSNKIEEEKTSPKIYLVKQTSQEKPKKRKRRSPKIAFEGLVVKPENVCIANQETHHQNSKKNRASF